MGLVDLVYVVDARCVCSEGHSLNGEDFETKDLGCTMGTAHVAAGRLTFDPGDYGHAPASSPVTARIWMCTYCSRCPRFKTKWGTVEHLVAFVVMVERGAVTSMERVSQPLSEWLQEEHVREAATAVGGTN